jgi:hypothetical protein
MPGLDTTYALDIEWEYGIQLPRLLGPFSTETEAQQWAELNVGDRATLRLRQLTYPYLQGPHCTASYTGSMPQLARQPDCCLNTGHVGDHTAVTGYRWPNETPIRAFREAR